MKSKSREIYEYIAIYIIIPLLFGYFYGYFCHQMSADFKVSAKQELPISWAEKKLEVSVNGSGRRVKDTQPDYVHFDSVNHTYVVDTAELVKYLGKKHPYKLQVPKMTKK